MAFDFKFPVVSAIQPHSFWGWSPKDTEHMTVARSVVNLANPSMLFCSQNEVLTSHSINQCASWSAPTSSALLPSIFSSHAVFLVTKTIWDFWNTLYMMHIVSLCLPHAHFCPVFPFCFISFGGGRGTFSSVTTQMLFSWHPPQFPTRNQWPFL